ncbi:MAG: protein-L-isoaspartate O-methyltransferase [Erythrobacter sp.]|nr:protein-L-isoaspartate O-methyltransferase [Erythrobacter sp.]
MTNIAASYDTADARKAMIDSQLRTSGVNEEFVLGRMLAVPREDFLPANKAALAYIDRSVSLDDGGYLASPLFYGKLLLEAEPMPTDRALVIEGGSGYLAELLRPLVAKIDVLEADKAANVTSGAEATYSLVVIDGAVEALPDGIAQMIEEDGRIVSGLVLRQVTRLASGRKVAGKVALMPVEDIGIPVLRQFDKPKSWSF